MREGLSDNSSAGELLWTWARQPTKWFADEPLAQCGAAVLLNLFFLWVAVLGQFWVLFSTVLAFVQFANALAVYRGRRTAVAALAIGVTLVAINYLALGLAVLAQFWVLLSTALATWQFVSLLRVCLRSHKG